VRNKKYKGKAAEEISCVKTTRRKAKVDMRNNFKMMTRKYVSVIYITPSLLSNGYQGIFIWD
jgi:hypothetical protein